MYISTDISADRLSLQNYFNLIYKWSLDWQLGQNAPMFNRSTCNPEYSIDNTLLNNVSTLTDIEVIVDEYLNFESHVDQICVKARQRSAFC